MSLCTKFAQTGFYEWSACHPQLPGCMSHGGTPREAEAMLADARMGYVATMIEDGQKETLRGLVLKDDGDIRTCLLCDGWWMVLDYEDHKPNCPAQPGDDE